MAIQEPSRRDLLRAETRATKTAHSRFSGMGEMEMAVV